MKVLINQLILIFFIAPVIKCYAIRSLDCVSIQDKNKSFGCKIENVEIMTYSAPPKIRIMIEENVGNLNISEPGIFWIQFSLTNFSDGFLPSAIFKSFPNIQELLISSSSGLKTLNLRSALNNKFRMILITKTDLETIGANDFKGLTGLKIISLNHNEINEIHKNAFQDAIKVELIELVNNSISYLDPRIFKNNISLKKINLRSNKLHTIPKALFEHNFNLISIELQENEIKQIQAGFLSHLINLETIDLRSNLCTNEMVYDIDHNDTEDWWGYVFENCYDNYDLLPYTTLDVMKKSTEKNVEVEKKCLDENLINLTETYRGDDFMILKNEIVTFQKRIYFDFTTFCIVSMSLLIFALVMITTVLILCQMTTHRCKNDHNVTQKSIKFLYSN